MYMYMDIYMYMYTYVYFSPDNVTRVVSLLVKRDEKACCVLVATVSTTDNDLCSFRQIIQGLGDTLTST